MRGTALRHDYLSKPLIEGNVVGKAGRGRGKYVPRIAKRNNREPRGSDLWQRSAECCGRPIGSLKTERMSTRTYNGIMLRQSQQAADRFRF